MATTAESVATAPAAPIGLLACVALVVGNMIGSGIFLLPAALAPFGPIAIGGWAVTSAGALVLALIFGRLARLVTRTGGPYAYTQEGFGDFAGFLIAWGYWITLWAGNAGVAVALAGYVGFFVPAVAATETLQLAVALLAIWTVTLVNLRGVREAGAVQMVTTILKLAPLLAIGAFGLLWFEPAHFDPVNPSGMSDVAAVSATAALTLWAFLGLESATVPAGEVRDPARTIPRATVLGVLIAAAVYILITFSALGVLPAEQLAASAAPLAEVAQAMWGPLGGALVAAGAVVSTIGTLNGFTLLSGQVPLGAARDHVFPAVLGRLTRHGTPGNALVLSNLLASLLIIATIPRGLVETFTIITLLATTASLIPYALCALAELMIWVRRGATVAERRGLVSVVALGTLGFLYAFWALWGAGAEPVFAGLLLLLAGVPIHVLITYRGRFGGPGPID